MSKELGLLNFLCLLATVGFLAMIVVTALSAGDILTIDTLFIMTVCLVMAVMFAASPLLYLKSEGKLPIPGMKRVAGSTSGTAGRISATAPPMLDARGRAIPPDVKAIVSQLAKAKSKEA